MRTLLITMPFISAHRPSIQIGLLSSIARQHKYDVETLHANLDLAEAIGLEDYEQICALRRRAIGDWLYSREAFRDDAPDPNDSFLSRFKSELPKEFSDGKKLLTYRHDLIPAHLDRVTQFVLDGKFDLVGFSSTFQQNAASIALARRLKERDPSIITLFGGANYEGAMGREYVRAIDVIDYAISGEADDSFVSFLDAISKGVNPAGLPGVLCRQDGELVAGEDKPFNRLNESPVPDYTEYFERSDELGITGPTGRRAVFIPFESSRGCWWGEKAHCTFCGLNGTTMVYRSKAPEQVLRELATLNEKHHSFHFEAVDNILDVSYMKEVFPAISEASLSYQFFFEVKSNLSREQIETLALGGVNRIQPGIESLSTSVLKRMKKGVRASANVNLLRWAKYYGVNVGWNILWGFPGELHEDYVEQATLFSQLHHLQPPGGGSRVWMERFSPMFTDQVAHPLKWKKPEESYEFVYPNYIDLDQAAYFFEYEMENVLADDEYSEINHAIEDWQAPWNNGTAPSLTVWKGSDVIQIEDWRNLDTPTTHTFNNELAEIYLECMSKPISASQLKNNLTCVRGEDELDEVLDEFVARGLMMRDERLFLSLALPSDGIRRMK